jgi:methionyl-tRNA formyltransferase
VGTTAPTLRGLIDAGYDVAAVVVAQSDIGKSRKPRGLEVADIAAQHGIPLLSPASPAAARRELSSYGAQAAVLIAYGRIVPAEVLGLFPGGIINVHPSLLPLHRGSTPIESAILEGAHETGVSLMKLNEKMDAGPLYETVTVPLEDGAAKQELADRLSAIGADLVLKYLPGILDDSSGAAVPVPQDDSKATRDSHIGKSDGVIDWSKPALRLEREVRAYAGWPKSRANLGSTEVIITRSRVAKENLAPGTVRSADKRLLVGTGKDSLEILALKPAGKREMSAPAFLAGHKI